MSDQVPPTSFAGAAARRRAELAAEAREASSAPIVREAEPEPPIDYARADEEARVIDGKFVAVRPSARSQPDVHRLLPSSPDAEKGILCSFLLAPVECGKFCEAKGVMPSWFNTPCHAEIFEELQFFWREGMPLDFITLTENFHRKGRLENVGGAAFVTELFTFLPTAANLAYYVEILDEKKTLRDLYGLHIAGAERCLTEQDSVPLLLSELEEKLKVIAAHRLYKDFAELLDSRVFDEDNPPPKAQPILMLNGVCIATMENFMVLQAKVKAGKTAVVCAILASTMEPTGDCLGFKSANPLGHAVIHFDTEQSRWDHHEVIMRALRRAGRKTRPKWMFSYYMKGLTVAQRLGMLRSELERRREQCGGIFMVILDGIADFCNDVNDPEEAVNLVAEIERLAMEFQTLFIVVIHENPGTEIGKTRGHLGSHLERKAETPLRLEKDGEGVTVMYADRARGCHIPKANGPRFAWSDEAKMHVSTEAEFKAPARAGQNAASATRKNSKLATARHELGKHFANGATHRFGGLLAASKIKEASFSRYWIALKERRLIIEEKSVKGMWSASPAWAAEIAQDFADHEEGAE